MSKKSIFAETPDKVYYNLLVETCVPNIRQKFATTTKNISKTKA